MPGRPREGSRHWQAAPEPVAANRSWLDSLLMAIEVGSAAGGMSGLLWGGVGGRVAMRVVLLTSDDRVRGLTSDDGFEIGRLSAATIRC